MRWMAEQSGCDGLLNISNVALHGTRRHSFTRNLSMSWCTGPSAGKWWLCMDSAHTGLSCASLVATLQAVFPQQPPVALVVGVAVDKDVQSMSRVLIELAPRLVVCVSLHESLSSRALSPMKVASAFESSLRNSTSVKPRAETQICVASSMKNARDIVFEWIQRVHRSAGQLSPENVAGRKNVVPEEGHLPVVCVTGSNYVVGSAMQEFQSQTIDTRG